MRLQEDSQIVLPIDKYSSRVVDESCIKWRKNSEKGKTRLRQEKHKSNYKERSCEQQVNLYHYLHSE